VKTDLKKERDKRWKKKRNKKPKNEEGRNGEKERPPKRENGTHGGIFKWKGIYGY